MKHIKHGFSLKAWLQSPGVDEGGGANVQNQTFPEHGHVAYQIKAHDACSNMIANIFPQTYPRPGRGVKRSNHFSESSHVAYKIKGNCAKSTMKTNILSLHTISTPGVWSKGKILFFSF